MKINRNNYEQYFIDHLDGRLDTSLAEEFNQFLKDNPDLNEELENFEPIDVNLQDLFIYTDKEKLKKAVVTANGQINSENYNAYFIAATEGDLTSAEEEEVKAFIKLNPHLQATFELFKISRLSPDQSAVFPNKSSLKKYPFLYFKTWYKPIGVAVAAGIILLFGILNILRPTKIEAPPVERAEIPSAIKRDKIRTIKLNYEYPALTSRNYQIFAVHTEEIMPIERLSKMTTIKVPIASFLASLSYPIPNINTLVAKDEYDFLAKELMIKEELLMASFGEPDPNSREKIEKALWAKSFGKQKRRKSREENFGDELKKPKVNLWTLASIGIESFNAFTGSNVNIERQPNKEGEKNKYILVNGNLSTTEITDKPE